MTNPRIDHFCTLFDKNYLFLGVALHRSLLRHGQPFRLYALAMDEVCERVLRALALEHMVVVSLKDVITPDLAWIRDRMSFGQICWTCQPLLCRHVLGQHGVEAVTYLEADSYFFDTPRVLLSEIGEGSVSLVPHNYLPQYDQSQVSGIYCVQFNLFRNDDVARGLLKEWLEACLKYDRQRMRYFPGQMCLDDWPGRSPRVHVVKHVGAGVAPWNVSGFKVDRRDGHPTVDGQNVIFYHFHELALVRHGTFFMTSYPLSRETVEYLYRSYLEELMDVIAQVRRAFPDFNYAKRFESPGLWRSLLSLEPERIRDCVKFLFRTVVRRNAMIRVAPPA